VFAKNNKPEARSCAMKAKFNATNHNIIISESERERDAPNTTFIYFTFAAAAAAVLSRINIESNLS